MGFQDALGLGGMNMIVGIPDPFGDQFTMKIEEASSCQERISV